MGSLTRHIVTMRERADLLRALQLTQWVGPGLMALIGIGYMLFGYWRSANGVGWLWLTLGLAVFGFVGPALSWTYLRWAINAAQAYLAAQQQLERRADELATLNDLSVAASRSLGLDAIISIILEQVMQALDADAGMVFVQENGQSNLRLEAHRGIPTDLAKRAAFVALSCGLCSRAMETRQVMFSCDLERRVHCGFEFCLCQGFRSAACTPLKTKGHLVGFVQMMSHNSGHFTEDQRSFLTTAAGQVGALIENARLYDSIQAFNVELEQMVGQRTRELELAQEELAEKARQLQRLLSESYRIQEETQARIAHDMHDGVTQLVIGALYEAQAAREALPKDMARAEANLRRAQHLLSEVETEIRRVVYDLHPPVLDRMGLVVALKRFAATFSASFDIECQIEVSGAAGRLSKEIEVAIYRIIQAALHNVATHAQASQARVGFDFTKERLRVVVEDNGLGFDLAEVTATPREHLGLIGMRERAEGLGATIAVHSRPGHGTRVILELPTPSWLD